LWRAFFQIYWKETDLQFHSSIKRRSDMRGLFNTSWCYMMYKNLTRPVYSSFWELTLNANFLRKIKKINHHNISIYKIVNFYTHKYCVRVLSYLIGFTREVITIFLFAIPNYAWFQVFTASLIKTEAFWDVAMVISKTKKAHNTWLKIFAQHKTQKTSICKTISAKHQ
jgi:hypothetical protein